MWIFGVPVYCYTIISLAMDRDYIYLKVYSNQSRRIMFLIFIEFMGVTKGGVSCFFIILKRSIVTSLLYEL
jgi:hypothetical protein